MSQRISTSAFSTFINGLGKSREKAVFLAGNSGLLDDLFETSLKTLSGGMCELSLPLAEKLLPLSITARSRRAIEFARDILFSNPKEVIFVRKIEILFQPDLRVNPLSFFRTLSQERTMVIRWPGDYANGNLTYAYPQHSEFFSSKPNLLPVVHEAESATYLTFTQ